MADGREYSGWIKPEEEVSPFIIHFSEYNAERKVYPVRIAMSTGGQALIANVALEGKSKAPIDFVIKGDVANPDLIGRFFGWDLSWLPSVNVNLSGGFDWQKITLRKSSVVLNDTALTVSGEYDWSKNGGLINANVSAKRVDLATLFPGLYGGIRIKPNRKLNIFKNIPLFGQYMFGKNVHLHLSIGDLVVYRDLNLKNVDFVAGLGENHLRLDLDTGIAEGNIKLDKGGGNWRKGVCWGYIKRNS